MLLIKGFFVYRFIDGSNNIIYIGKTTSLITRLITHFQNGHLPKEIYKEVERVDYISTSSMSEMDIYEVYLINKHRPINNKINNRGDSYSFQLPTKKWTVLERSLFEVDRLNTSLSKTNLDQREEDLPKSEYELLYEKYQKVEKESHRVPSRIGFCLDTLDNLLSNNQNLTQYEKGKFNTQLNYIRYELLCLENFNEDPKDLYQKYSYLIV